MKNYIVLMVLLIATFKYSFGQFECSIGSNLKTSGNITNSSDYIPDYNTPIKYLRVNIHFMLLQPSHADYPGNFAMNNDGNGDYSYTGYHYANELINKVNSKLAGNYQMNMPPGNSTDVIERKYRFILNGVFFHEDNNYYYYPSYPNGIYGNNLGEAINVFINQDLGAVIGGHANMTGNRWVEINDIWDRYLDDIATGRGRESGLGVTAHTLNHEIGHNLSLNHTVRYNLGLCYDNQEDYCPDTPTRKEIRDNYGFDPCCGWGGGSNCSNNIMDYSGADAITPDQLGRVHWTIENEIEQYRSCHYNNDSVSVVSFSANSSYIGKTITLPLSNTVVVENDNALYINAHEFIIYGELEIKLGSRLVVNITPECN